MSRVTITLTSPVYQLLGLVSLFILVISYARRTRNKLPLPPGPRPLPLVGNLFDMPRDRPWIAYGKWAGQYNSDILYFQLPFRSVIVLDSLTAAHDLLEKRSNIYADKPLTVMDEISGWDWNMALMPYSQRWRSIRRVFHQQFNSGAVYKYREVQAREVAAYLRRELDRGGATVRSVNHLFSAIILDIAYGIKIKSMDDPVISLFQEAVESFNEINVPGAFWVDSFPLLRHIPAWVPGTTFHRYGAIYKPKVYAMKDRPFEAAKADIAQGVVKQSIAHKIVNTLQERYSDDTEYAEREGHAKDAVSVAYSAGVETSYSSTSWFILAMAMNPHVQEKAQHELDRVIGPDRLPSHADLDSLPYLYAILLETLRWMPAVPVGIPHLTMAEDEYKGYRIPKRCMVIYNVWKMCHNPEVYSSPNEFNPDRFIKDGGLNSDVRDPSIIVFGFGRRMCPGRHFAKESLMLTFSSILSVYTIEPALDEVGKPVKLTTKAPGGVLLHPERLDCVFKPRSAYAAQLIRQSGP